MHEIHTNVALILRCETAKRRKFREGRPLPLRALRGGNLASSPASLPISANIRSTWSRFMDRSLSAMASWLRLTRTGFSGKLKEQLSRPGKRAAAPETAADFPRAHTYTHAPNGRAPCLSALKVCAGVASTRETRQHGTKRRRLSVGALQAHEPAACPEIPGNWSHV